VVLLLPLLALWSCRSDPVALEDCADAACERERLEAAWLRDPAGTLEGLAQVSDPAVRALGVEVLAQAHPTASAELCPLAPQGPTRRWCEGVATTPLLWSVQAQAGEPADEAAQVLAPGPTLRLPPLPAAAEASCAAEVPADACQAHAAREAALLGQVSQAAAACAGVASPRWQAACMFQSASIACREGQTEPCDEAAELCLWSGSLRGACLSEVASALAAQAPGAERRGSAAWAGLVAQVRALRRRLQAVDAILADRVADRTWAEALARSYGAARVVVGNPADDLPDEALPALRAAVAWRLSPDLAGLDLDRAAERVTTALAARSGGQRQLASPAPVRPTRSLWARNLPGEEALPQVAWLGDLRRTTSTEAAVDIRICVLEAMARQDPPGIDLLVEGLGDPDRLVRWTSARLLSQVAPGHTALGHVREYADPLVRARAGG